MVNNEGNAEIMGVVLLISIFVAAIALMGVTMLSAPQPEKVPAVAFDFWTDDDHTNISLVHRGGENLNLSGARLKVIYSNGSSSENPAVGIDGGSAKSWSEVAASSTYGIGNSINFTTDQKVDQVQLVWPGTGGASMTGGGGPVLIGAWSTNSSSGKNPPAAVTGAVPVTFPYASEGPTWTQPTQTPAVPWVYFIGKPTATNGTLPIIFTNLTENQGAYGLLWNFGDNSPSSPSQTKSIIHSFPDPATFSSPYFKKYTVTLNLTNSSDGTNTSYSLSRPEYITVYMKPDALIRTPTVTEGNSPFTITFHDESTGYVTEWLWTYGDSETSTQQNPIHEFRYIYGANPTIYSVILKAIDPFESDLSDPLIIRVHQPLIADFTESPNPGVANSHVQFTDTSTGDLIYNWLWDFGDGTPTSAFQNPNHTYTAAYTYNVSLTIINPWGTNTTIKPFNVTGAPLSPPVANFTATPTAGNAPLPVQFTDTSVGTGITSWNWDFGDGNTSTSQNPSHTYATNGTYTVTLVVTNPAGQSAPVTKTITVQPPLIAAFGGAPLIGNAALNVSFADQSTGYNITGYNWNFGDGSTSTSKSPWHIYTTNGTYTVNLTITNPYGIASVSKPAFVTVLPQLVANFTANRTAGNAQLPVQFNDTSTGDGINGWSWDFGDNTTESIQNPTHTYSRAGIYNITLTAFNSYGNNTTTRTGYITVLQPPVAAFNGTPTVGNGQVNVNFTDLSTGEGITNWNWDFGDGTTSTSRNPLHLYTNLGTIPETYNVTLTINNTYEINATTRTRYITAYPPLVANFTTTATTGDAPLQVDFTDTSTGYDIIGWTWDFGDGSPTGSLRNANYTYTTPGTYTASLVVTNPFGQSAPATRMIIVNVPPTTPIPAGGVINGTIFNDQNGDGVANTGDPKLAGWTINLMKNGNVIATTTSDAAGAYGFYGVATGSGYTVEEILPVGWQGTNPAGGVSDSIQINPGSKRFHPNTNFWNYYKPVTAGGNINLNAQKQGYLVSGGYLQFTDTISYTGSTGITIGGQFVQVNQGDIVKIVVRSTGTGNIYIGGGQISTMQLQDAAVYINNNLMRTGQITAININGYSNLVSTLTVTVPSRSVWTSFTVNGAQVIPGQNDSRIINLYNVSTRSDNVLNLQVGVSTYIDGSTGTYQLLP